MSFLVRCRVCGQALRSPESAAGTTVPCAKCGNPIVVPATIETDPLVVLRQMVEAASQPALTKPPTPTPAPETTAKPTTAPPPLGNGPASRLPPPTSTDPLTALRQLVEAASQAPGAQPPKRPTPAPAPETTAKEFANPPTPENHPAPPGNLYLQFKRHLHWALALALIPLVISFLTDEPEKPIRTRLIETLSDATPEERQAIVARLEFAKSLDDVFSLLPEERLNGAYLPRSSNAHWLMAGATAVVYLSFLMLLASGSGIKRLELVGVGLLTATIGVGFLLLVQWLASLTQGFYVMGGGVMGVIFYILKFINFSYTAAFHPETGFLLSFLGFTLGVGLCEEIVKALPVFSYSDRSANWRGLFLWGLASGIGFGIAESILYSAEFYNGVAGSHIYLIRFVSCVALHAIWTGSVAIWVSRNRDTLQFDMLHASSVFEWLLPALFAVTVPVVLHGLYDTCVKKELYGFAALIAVASFAYLGFLLRAPEPRDPTRPGTT